MGMLPGNERQTTHLVLQDIDMVNWMISTPVFPWTIWVDVRSRDHPPVKMRILRGMFAFASFCNTLEGKSEGCSEPLKDYHTCKL